MNPYIIKTTCDLCGGDAVATPQDESARWIMNRKFGPTTMVHQDPQVCANEFERKRRQQEAQVPQEAYGG